jgi:hypothetical protein
VRQPDLLHFFSPAWILFILPICSGTFARQSVLLRLGGCLKLTHYIL